MHYPASLGRLFIVRSLLEAEKVQSGGKRELRNGSQTAAFHDRRFQSCQLVSAKSGSVVFAFIPNAAARG
jgi:hypothetical protein